MKRPSFLAPEWDGSTNGHWPVMTKAVRRGDNDVSHYQRTLVSGRAGLQEAADFDDQSGEGTMKNTATIPLLADSPRIIEECRSPLFHPCMFGDARSAHDVRWAVASLVGGTQMTL